MIARPAEPGDLAAVVSLTRKMRSRLARWEPVYFHPADDADDLHAGFLEFIIGADAHRTQVLCLEHAVIGFFVTIEQEAHVWVDDLCIADETMWPASAAESDGGIGSPWSSSSSSPH